MTENSAHSEILLSANGLVRSFAGVAVLHDINLELARGQVTGFLGLNGAGKTTTMRLLSGTLAPDSGSVTIAGHDLLTHPNQARAHLGYLPDEPPVYPELCVDEYLHYCGVLRGIARNKLAQAIATSKAQTGLESKGSQRIERLSRGYRQRLGIAQAIIHEPDAIILDEPTSGLDPRQIEEIRSLIRSLGESRTVLLSTHLLAEVRAVCSAVLVIHNGRVVYRGAVDASLEDRFFAITGSAAP